MSLEEKTAKKIVGERRVEVIIVTNRLSTQEARMMFPYRPHDKYSESRFGGNMLTDDTALLLSGSSVRCQMCRAPTRKEYLIDITCPDCDGRSEYNGTNPREC